MNHFFKRFLHSTKITVGNLVGKLLQYLFFRRQGTAYRLHQGLSNSMPLKGYNSRVLIEPTPVQLYEPEFFIRGFVQEKYLKMMRNYGSKTLPSSGIISANNFDISFPLGTHLWNGNLFEEALLDTYLLTNPKYTLNIETIPFKNKKKFSEAILLSLPWHHNFFHWMIEILPRLALYDLAENVHHLKLIVPKSSPGFVRESLKLFGYENIVYFIEDGVYRFEKLHVLSRLAESGDISPLAIKWLTQKIKLDKIGTSKKRIYVSRSDATIRYVTNELEIQNLLSEFGFETVVMSQYTLEQQINIFQQAEVVVGSHGAAFAHTAFMKPETIFIEFFKSGHFNRCFYRIACLKKLRYGFLVGQKNGLGFSINIAQLKSLLKQALL